MNTLRPLSTLAEIVVLALLYALIGVDQNPEIKRATVLCNKLAKLEEIR